MAGNSTLAGSGHAKNIGIGWKCQTVTNTLAYYTKRE
jgi:hypothetical protein